ncbi:MAG: hypothetical protein ACD_9C00025G0004 [uncultured bacterium]|nr:MAG: hypothetical protein ACD_9C00025G0004 [uncultured bacterium]
MKLFLGRRPHKNLVLGTSNNSRKENKMRNEWNKNEDNGWNPVVFLSLNEEWILEVNKERLRGILHKIGNIQAGESITAFKEGYDFEDFSEHKYIQEITNPLINADGFCEGEVKIRYNRGGIKNYKFQVNLKTGERRITKIPS